MGRLDVLRLLIGFFSGRNTLSTNGSVRAETQNETQPRDSASPDSSAQHEGSRLDILTGMAWAARETHDAKSRRVDWLTFGPGDF